MTFAIWIITLLIVIAVIGQVFTHRVVKSDRLEPSQGMVEAMLGVVGTLFSLLLGLLVANAIESFHEVDLRVAEEANSLANIYRLAEGVDPKDGENLKKLCAEYNHCVIHTEWKEMDQQNMSQHCWDVYGKIWTGCVSLMPKNEREVNIQASMLESAKSLGAMRRSRSVSCRATISPMLWCAIFFGSAITIVFTYFFTSKMGRLHTLLTALIAISLGLNIWLLAAYSLPFNGDLKIEPAIFEMLDTQVFKYKETTGKNLE